MLKRWHIRNFKSFKDVPPIELSAINVLAGANSSGKSSLIQSILLLKQTLQYGPQERAVSLNGPLVRLGSFEDVRNFRAVGDDLSIGCEFGAADNEYLRQPEWARSYYSLNRAEETSWQHINLSVRLGTSSKDADVGIKDASGDLNPTLISTCVGLKGISSGEEIVTRSVELRHRPDEWLYTVVADALTSAELVNDRPQGYIEGAVTEHFLPEMAVVRYNQALSQINDLVSSLFRPNESLLTRASLADEAISPGILAIVNRWLLAHGVEELPDRDGPTLASEVRNKLSSFVRRNPFDFSTILAPAIGSSDNMRADIESLKEEVKSALIAERPAKMRPGGGRSGTIDYAVGYLSDFFRYGVKYLGPLRDSPKPVYQPEALESTTDVGYRGEHTAAVYDINKRNEVTFVLPPASNEEHDFVGSSETTTAGLEDAVATWLQYLGVAASVETTDMGVFGNRLRVAVQDGLPLHDLTNVGVGVSQVLPIVVMSLLAPAGSLLIFEQPELHLHPRVQARLADFFLALAVQGKQTLLETHSEYLVDRLRLRIALSPDDTVRPLVNILFSEKREGESVLTPVQISEYGAITNWPADFFDQSQQDVGRIVQAAANKRKRKHK